MSNLIYVKIDITKSICCGEVLLGGHNILWFCKKKRRWFFLKRISKTQRRIKFYEIISRLSLYAQYLGIKLLPTCFHRSAAEQMKLRAQGKSKVKRSFHQDWLAMDFVIVKDGALCWTRWKGYDALGEAWEKMGGVWGGRWTDPEDIYHFQEGTWFGHEWFFQLHWSVGLIRSKIESLNKLVITDY